MRRQYEIYVTGNKMLFLLPSLFLLITTCSTADSKDYHVEVKTGNGFWAGTDATVKIRVQGTKGNLPDRDLDGKFEKGDKEYFQISDETDIGYVTGMEVYRGNEGFSPTWELDYIIIKIAGAKDSIFNYYEDVSSGWTRLTLSCTSGNVINAQGFCVYILQEVPVQFNSVTYLGDKKTCTDHNKKFEISQWCTCPFVLCTEAPECTQNVQGDDVFCRLLHENIDYTADLSREDCECTDSKK